MPPRFTPFFQSLANRGMKQTNNAINNIGSPGGNVMGQGIQPGGATYIPGEGGSQGGMDNINQGHSSQPGQGWGLDYPGSITGGAPPRDPLPKPLPDWNSKIPPKFNPIPGYSFPEERPLLKKPEDVSLAPSYRPPNFHVGQGTTPGGGNVLDPDWGGLVEEPEDGTQVGEGIYDMFANKPYLADTYGEGWEWQYDEETGEWSQEFTDPSTGGGFDFGSGLDLEGQFDWGLGGMTDDISTFLNTGQAPTFTGGGGQGGQAAKRLHYPGTSGGFASVGSGMGGSTLEELLKQYQG